MSTENLLRKFWPNHHYRQNDYSDSFNDVLTSKRMVRGKQLDLYYTQNLITLPFSNLFIAVTPLDSPALFDLQALLDSQVKV